MPRTVVSFHAHPDDETLLTGGTLAKLASAGHRVVIVTATDGGAGLAAERLRSDGRLAARRLAELERAAEAIGAASVRLLGYTDSGMSGAEPGDAFARADVEEAARLLADLLVEEQANLLTVYDSHGGYGHPDHVQVHRVGIRAARLAGTPRVMEATLDRELMQRALRLMRVARLASRVGMPPLDNAFTARADLTHRIDVRQHLAAKRAAMAAHVSQRTADETDRALAFFLRLPEPVFRLVFGHEWFVRRGASACRPLADDLLDEGDLDSEPREQMGR